MECAVSSEPSVAVTAFLFVENPRWRLQSHHKPRSQTQISTIGWNNEVSYAKFRIDF